MNHSSDRLCKDCKHARRDFVDRLSGTWQFAKCSLSTYHESVGGKTYHHFCSIERNSGRLCGPEAKKWEPKS